MFLMNKNKSQTKQDNKKRSPVRSFLRGLSVVLISCLIVGFATSCIIAGYMITNIVMIVNGEKITDLSDAKKNQRQTSIIYAKDDDGKDVEIARLKSEVDREWINSDKMPKHLQNAFVAIEDKRFYEHSGVDWRRTISVLIVPENEGQGGSTITQQLIKNVKDEKDVTFVRKFNEILSALNLEKNYNKEAILEAYLNTIYLGSGCYGVKTAAKTYFGKTVSELNLAESACLAVITKSPYDYDPIINPNDNKDRQIYCLKQMLIQGMITPDEYVEAVNYKLVFAEEDEKEEVEDTSEVQSYFVDFVISKVMDDLIAEKDMTEKEAFETVYYGGLRIYTTLNTKIQEIMEDVFENRITFPYEADTEDNPAVQAAMTVVDYEGHVVGIVGGAGEKPGNRCLNRAYDSPRPPGSTIKPIATYAPAINEGIITWSSFVKNSSFRYAGKLFPKNSDGTNGDGQSVTVQRALALSLNTVPARIINEKLTINTSLDYLINKFHISTIDTRRDCDLAPLSIGAMTYGMTTVDMAEAFAVFGSGGICKNPKPYTLITNSDGSETILTDDKKGERVLSEGTSDVMIELMKTVTEAGGTGYGYGVSGMPTYAKTGTTDDYKDRLFNGGTPYYCASVWYGYDMPKAITNVYGNPAGKIFKEVMTRIHADLEYKDFEKSDYSRQLPYCAYTGLVATPSCVQGGKGWYTTDNMPYCTSCGGYYTW